MIHRFVFTVFFPIIFHESVAGDEYLCPDGPPVLVGMNFIKLQETTFPRAKEFSFSVDKYRSFSFVRKGHFRISMKLRRDFYLVRILKKIRYLSHNDLSQKASLYFISLRIHSASNLPILFILAFSPRFVLCFCFPLSQKGRKKAPNSRGFSFSCLILFSASFLRLYL